MNPTVHGGSGGIAARGDDLLTLARLYDDAGDDLRRSSGRLVRLLTEMASRVDLVVAAALAPTTAARAARETGDAAAALLPLAVTSESHAQFLRLAVTAYREADDLLAGVDQLRKDLVGLGMGLAAPAVLVGGGLVVGGAYLHSEGLEDATEQLGWDGAARCIDATQARAGGFAQRVLTTFPGIVEDVAGGAAGVENGLLLWLPPSARPLLGRRGYPTSYDEAVESLAAFFPDGRPVTGPGGPVREADMLPPAGVADLLAGVDRRQMRQPTVALPEPAQPGEIGVKKLVAPDGRIRWVVELPGTEGWPLTPGGLVRDTTTNLHTMGGDRTAYMQGVERALADAGARRGQPVMLVGHSLGGMTAVALAADAGFRARFDVTHVVTAASPIARTSVPPDVQVLALENVHDIVPTLDGRPNADAVNVTTVRWAEQRGTVGENHALATYRELVVEDLPDAASVRTWTRGAAGFFDPGARVEQHENVAISRGDTP